MEWVATKCGGAWRQSDWLHAGQQQLPHTQPWWPPTCPACLREERWRGHEPSCSHSTSHGSEH